MAASKQTLISLLGSFDNFDEPVPSWNRPSTIIPTLTSFLVRASLAERNEQDLTVFPRLLPIWDWWLTTQHGFGQHFLLLQYTEMQTYLKVGVVVPPPFLSSLPRDADETAVILCCKCHLRNVNCISEVGPAIPVSSDLHEGVSSPRATCYGYGSLIPSIFYGTYSSAAAINMVLDITILIIPMPLYFRENTGNRTKLSLIGLLFLGGLVNFLSIWRMATIVEHTAATKPTFDPTWYGPISILLASLEVDVATICASVPVFWPVLTSKLGHIFVTQEIKIERAHRFSTIEDEYELERGTRGGRRFRERRRRASGSGPHTQGSKIIIQSNTIHYKDKYVVAQVDPLSDMGRVESEITAQPLSRKQSRTGVGKSWFIDS
ncbi:uncharacterized protein JN550_012123 [Neoarthrinium moseri]|uniref:uncharacterized protein n=1 Tax=Neoarthrinium moseri TaxID=1658444 RepID=UPI001FDDA598|nr:uncharacterized protein JN550_012123 [Neoarthrinium moseri]KAI1859314.1 hypothetical protein JN550_012123 [Neoarthrinium moseri]